MSEKNELQEVETTPVEKKDSGRTDIEATEENDSCHQA